jgi:hypothetical protein
VIYDSFVTMISRRAEIAFQNCRIARVAL